MELDNCMKLLLCLECSDVVKLKVDELRFCSCGKAQGKYYEGGLHAEISGPCVSLGLHNQELVKAIKAQIDGAKDFDKGLNFTAWVISKSSPRVIQN